MRKIYIALLAAAFSVTLASAQCANVCTFVASAQATGNSSGVTINKPVGVAPNDVMVAAIHVGWCNSGSSVTPPLGWTLIAETSNTGSGCGSSNTSKQLATFYKVAGNAEPTTYTFTGSSNQFYVGGIVAYSGVNTVSPINASSNFGTQDSCSQIRATSVTTTAPCTKLIGVFFCSVNYSATNIVPPGSMTERVDVGTTGNHPWGNENLEMADEMIFGSGATGSRTAALSGCNSDGWVTGAQLIALECESGLAVPNPLPVQNLFSVFPNPSSGKMEITLREKPAPGCTLEMYDCVGRMVKTMAINASSTTADLSDQPKGIYFLKLLTAQGSVVQKIVVE